MTRLIDLGWVVFLGECSTVWQADFTTPQALQPLDSSERTNASRN